MPTVVYFGDRYNKFKAAFKYDSLFYAENLPPKKSCDIVVIDGCPKNTDRVPMGTVGVVFSENLKGLECLMRSGVRTVTCGMSHRDTVTVSSSVPELVICLQRRLPNFNGPILEPQEIPAAPIFDDISLTLLVAGTKLLCGINP